MTTRRERLKQLRDSKRHLRAKLLAGGGSHLTIDLSPEATRALAAMSQSVSKREAVEIAILNEYDAAKDR